MFNRTNNFPFSPNFDFATDNLLNTQVNQNFVPVSPGGNNFLLLNGSPMLLLNGDNLTLL